MSVFENLVIENKNQIIDNRWIEWHHALIPTEPEWLRKLVRILLFNLGHCLPCTSLSGCYFALHKMPPQPLHPNCDCKKLHLDYNEVRKAQADMPLEKITNYIFGEKFKENGKQDIFINLGFNKNNAELLKRTFEIQARENYIKGNYNLKQLDNFGQRLAIPIVLNDKKFLSGWMVYPKGKIKNTTPFGGWIK
ncbi:MAG: hypothetical protein J6A98_01515 [Clostridia bacterium]|nr:hypothetical protein [Clostridia bacterium]